MQSFAVETLRPHPVRDLKAKIILHLPLAALVGNEEVTLTSKPDRNGIAIDRHFSLEIAEEREAVPGHRDVLRQAEELTDTAVAPWGRREGVGRVPLDDDYMAAPSPTRQVIGDTGADDSTANYENVAVHCPIPCHPTVIVATRVSRRGLTATTGATSDGSRSFIGGRPCRCHPSRAAGVSGLAYGAGKNFGAYLDRITREGPCGEQ